MATISRSEGAQRQKKRVRLGLLQRQLADAAGVGLRSVQRAEKGGPIEPETLEAIDEALAAIDARGLDAVAPQPFRPPLLQREAAGGPPGPSSSLGGRESRLHGRRRGA